MTYTPDPNGGDYLRRDPNSAYGWPVAPSQELPPQGTVPLRPPEAPQRFGEAATLEQTADLSSLVQSILTSISAAANSASRPDLKVDEPASGGIRGEGQSPTGTDVAAAGASQEIEVAGDKLASALQGVVAMIETVQTPAPASVQAEAKGGFIRRWFDRGGGVSGPGTSTSAASRRCSPTASMSSRRARRGSSVAIASTSSRLAMLTAATSRAGVSPWSAGLPMAARPLTTGPAECRRGSRQAKEPRPLMLVLAGLAPPSGPAITRSRSIPRRVVRLSTAFCTCQAISC
ncbi:hypothetical protein ACVIGA_007550 [Bradyrhizobium sp. USDA 3240]